MLMVGLALVWLGGFGMLAERFPHSAWVGALFWAGVGFLIWYLFVPWLFSNHRGAEAGRGSGGEDGLTFLAAVCAGLVVHFWKPPLTVSLLGVLGAILFLGVGRIRGRRYYVAAAGWLLAALAAPRLPAWSGTQLPYAPLGLIGGFGTALQGGWELAGSLRLRATAAAQLASTPGPAGTS
ncbi:MAG TPA: hypothetical protein VKF41_08710 [Bryobacteraceae bacterium]|nr:hypothetical protein [Bryobacteraceae bacterium]